jgi:alpha-2-macroglobulin
VQEEAVSGRVRTTVKDEAKGQYLRDVHVKVIGNRNDDFVSGATDLRGVFVADGIKGNSTVIAEVEPSRYAFFRGQTNLTTDEEPMKAAEGTTNMSAKACKTSPSPAAKLEDSLLQNVKGSNKANQTKQVEQLQEMYKNVDEGVKAQKAF